MAQNIKLKRSATPGKVPTTSSLDLGEVAINTWDGRAFLRISSSVTQSIEHIVTTNSTTTGSITITRTGSFGELVVTQDGNFQRDIFVTRDIVGNGDIDVVGSLTASLTQGYVWVGDAGNKTKIVTTSSLGGASTDITQLNSFTASTDTKFTTLQNVTSSLNTYTASANTNFTNIHTFTASVSNSVLALNVSSASQQNSINLIGGVTSSLNTYTASANTNFTNIHTFTASVSNSISLINSVTSSLNSKTGSYATTGSNFFNGNQTITGSLIVSSSTAYLQVDGSPNSTILSIRSGSKEILLISSSQDLIISGALTVDVGTLADYLTAGYFLGTQNNYLELAVQNLSSGVSASTDIVAYANNATFTSSFIDMGINSSGITTGYNYGGPNDAYVYNTGGDLYIGNNTAFYQPSVLSQSLFLFANASASPDFVINNGKIGIGKSGSLNAKFDVFADTIISGSLVITGSLSASLQQGYVWVGGASNRTVLVATSSLGGGTATDISSLNTYTSSANVRFTNIEQTTASLNNSVSSINSRTASFALFSKGIAIVNNSGLAATDTGSIPIWRSNVACSASLMLIYRAGGTGATVNITKNGSNINIGTFSSSVADTWISSSALQTQGFAVGDRLAVNLTSFTGSVTEVVVQVDFTTLI